MNKTKSGIVSCEKMDKNDNCKYIFLVHFSIIKKLHEILKDSTRLKLQEICIQFELKFKQKLLYFLTRENELVLECDSPSNESIDDKMPQGWNGLDDLIERIDFTNVLHKNVRKVSEKIISSGDIAKYESLHFQCEFSGGSIKKSIQHLTVFHKWVGKNEIPCFFDKFTWKTNYLYTGYITHIYDPSKFWMRFGDIDTMQNLLWDFYYNKSKEFNLRQSDLCVGMNCAALIEDIYYRGKIIRIDVQDPNSFVLFLYDYGKTHKVKKENLFRLHEKFSVFPALAVRCILSNVSPLDNYCWTEEAVRRFQELTKYGKKVVAKISHLKLKRKILEVYLVDLEMKSEDKFPTINHQLVSECLAKIYWREPVETTNDGIFECLTKFTYLYPTHEMIENGIAPSDLFLTNQLKKCLSSSWDVLFPELYKYKG